MTKKTALPTVPQGGINEEVQFSPINNMGVTGLTKHRDACIHQRLIMTSDGPKPVLCRLPAAGECAVVDWVNFTFGLETLFDLHNVEKEYMNELSQTAIIECLPALLEHLFGFKLGEKCATGRNFYKHAWILDDGMGLICSGGQSDTVLVMLSGQGCTLARQGWERRLFNFLTTQAIRAKLTRVDVAHDDFEGDHSSADWADWMDKQGGFWCGRGKKPVVQHLGCWRRPDGNGRTLTIGRRESGKYYRGYERGRKEGDKGSKWFRSEVEFKSVDRFIPFDILLNPSNYFIGSYPVFVEFDKYSAPLRIKTAKKQSLINWQKAIDITRHQFGKYIKVFADVYGAEELIKLISYKGDPLKAKPRRLKFCLDLNQSLVNQALAA